MRALHSVRGFRARAGVLLVGVAVFVIGRDVSAAGQDRARTSLAAAAAARGAQQAAAAPARPSVKRLTLDEAVAMALDANLGIKAERLSIGTRERSGIPLGRDSLSTSIGTWTSVSYATSSAMRRIGGTRPFAMTPTQRG